jgi:Reverse transcriptase (RNA-dependent DNA polymerase)/Endonuclease-reverse transcriptase
MVENQETVKLPLPDLRINVLGVGNAQVAQSKSENFQLLVHINIQSLSNKIDRIDSCLYGNSLVNKAEVFCITEHWLVEAQLDSAVINGYKLVSHFCRSNFKNGGSAIFTKVPNQATALSKYDRLNLEKHFECTVAEIKSNKCLYLIGCIYRSPQGDFNVFINQLSELLNDITKKSSCILICGDFNINTLVQSKSGDILIDLFRSHGLRMTIDVATRITRNSSTSIDNVFTNIDPDLMTAQVIDLGLSDHCAQVINVHGVIDIPKQSVIYKRSFTERNKANFAIDVSSETWDCIENVHSVNDMYSAFLETFLSHFNKAFPIEAKRIKIKCNGKDNSWFTPELGVMCQEVRAMYNRSKSGAEVPLKEYNDLVRSYRDKLQAAKRARNVAKIQKSNNKSKASWELVSSQRNSTIGNHTKEIKLTTKDGILVSDPQKVVNLFSDHFRLAVQDLTLSRTPSIYASQRPSGTAGNKTIFLSPITKKEYYDIIDKACRKKSAGIDEVPCNILKEVAPFIMYPLMLIIDASFAHGKFPESLKITKLIPIFKKGDKSIINNYRPIALLSVFSKIIELAMYHRLIKFLEKQKILNARQHGFMRGKSTETAIASFTHSVLEALNNREEAVGIFYDFSKAFDTVNHEILLMKLNDIGIKGVANNWIRSFLLNRPQIVSSYVNNNKYFSKAYTTNVGVPQGSTLSPLLFILYTNDISTQVKTGELTLYADDTSHLITRAKDSQNQSIVQLCNLGTRDVHNFCSLNDLYVNANKTTMIEFQPKHIKSKPTSNLIRLDGRSIQEKLHTMFLGVVIDKNLDWSHHIDHISSQVSSGCYLIKRLLQVADFQTAKSVYYAHIQSRLQYGIVLWGNSTYANRLFILQKRAVRYLARSSRNPCAVTFYKDSCKPLFIHFKIMTLPCLYIFQTILFFVNNCTIERIVTNSSVHNYETRTKDDFRTKEHNLNLLKKDPFFAGAKLINALPKHIKEKKGLQFYSNLKNFLLLKAFYSVTDFCKDL